MVISKPVLHVDELAFPALVTCVSLVQQARFAKRVGHARTLFKVPVPEVTGDPGFVRVFRAHQNSVEFFPLAMSSLWLSAIFFHPVAASAGGVMYMIGRQRYFDGYSLATELRVDGFRMCVNALLALLITSGVGITTSLFRHYADIDLATKVFDLFAKVVNRQ